MNNIEWGQFNLEELFGKSTRGKRLKSADRVSGDLPFVTAGEGNEGVSAFVGNDITVFLENTTTVDMFGSAKYRNYKYGADDHIAVVHTEHLPKSASIFVTAAIHKSSHTGKFDYGRNFYAKDADELNIELPINNGQIDWDLMESFIKDLEASRIGELETYLSAAGLNDYTLTKEEKTALDKLEKTNWRTFKIEEVLVWQQKIAELSPLDLDSLSVSEEEKYPFYGQATANHGIIEYRHLNDDVLNNKLSKPTILIHSNNQNTVYLETPFYLKDGHGATSVLQSDQLDSLNAQFLLGSIQKVIVKKFAYNNKATKIALKNTEISLPVKADDTPDYDYMGYVISAIQKLVIKDVCLYVDQKA
ncbi:restriction endonuclease subunit S [Moritella viscosa]|uniref:restriction endonuclease subunit S n=1 Tax=Moritella viscosa TaxID=80854 RepID=UPI000916B1E6|nr:restriction endonuclease subunit S [Moritella viscosa]SGZ09958.1 Conserved domain protein [Moritella viscosa]